MAALAARRDLSWTGLDACLSSVSEIRKRLTAAVIVDIETLPRLPPGQQVVLAADILEHLRDPGRMLRLIHDALVPGGRLFLSVPNVANVHVRLNLLLGRFNYTDRGILDRTHCVFFTQRSARDLLTDTGFEVEKAAVSVIPLPLVLPGVPRNVWGPLLWALDMSTRLVPRLLGYQLLFAARRP